jgi:hypothetical protein
MKRLLLILAVFGLFTAAMPASARPSHKAHKVKRHKGVKRHS